MNEKRVQEIDDILNNRKEMSLICDIDDLKEKEEKLLKTTKLWEKQKRMFFIDSFCVIYPWSLVKYCFVKHI